MDLHLVVAMISTFQMIQRIPQQAIATLDTVTKLTVSKQALNRLIDISQALRAAITLDTKNGRYSN